MLVYYYDNEFLFSGTGDAFLDPETSKQQGEAVYFIPSNATKKAAPTQTGYIAKFVDNDWVLIPDYRGKYCVNENMIPQEINKAGELPAGYVLITPEQIELLNEKGSNYFIISGNELIKNPNYEQEEEEKEQQRISMLHMTKYDFFKHICQPNNITYSQLMQMVSSSDDVAAAWNLCAYVYRGDEILIASIKTYLPGMTDEALTEIFEEYGE